MDQIGKYRVDGDLGRGGFGTVYRGWDPEMRRAVAIKVINLHLGGDVAALARFRAEAATTANLHHRNIVTIYDSGEHLGQPWFSMEFLDGRTLAEALKETPGLELWEKVNILLQIAEGLLYAHERGVVHRDIKPSNVMLLAHGAVKVLDFGIARLMDPEVTRHATMTGAIHGTFGYLAPEQLEGGGGDVISDIFSFGVVCYETLSGVQPFHANSLPHAVNLIANFDPAPVCEIVPECPARLQEIVQKAMTKDPSRRYRSLRDLILDLAPVEASLRTARATQLALEAEALFGKGASESARSRLERAFTLDRSNEKGQALRQVIGEDFLANAATTTIRHEISAGDRRRMADRSTVIAEPARVQVPAPVRRRGALYLLIPVAIGLGAAGYWFVTEKPESAPATPPVTKAERVRAPKPPPQESLPQPAREPKLPVAVGLPDVINKAIRTHEWAAAAASLKQFEEKNHGDSRIRDWKDAIGKGKSQDEKIDDLREAVAKAVRSRNWGKADSAIRKLLTEVPGDPGAVKARDLVARALNADQRLKALGSSVQASIKAKQWDEAERAISELLSILPDDSQALKWRKQVAERR